MLPVKVLLFFPNLAAFPLAHGASHSPLPPVRFQRHSTSAAASPPPTPQQPPRPPPPPPPPIPAQLLPPSPPKRCKPVTLAPSPSPKQRRRPRNQHPAAQNLADSRVQTTSTQSYAAVPETGSSLKHPRGLLKH
ncbi:hypothetical protein PVAP13_2NG256003 [Panicum virgatum]|uniref:Uncharacterized protein n=1 Tax=Panicum virgatum TaxID=38727 RepID=A0A8T0VJZ4_PANVG|nr:hypothetical protein PVAP13_2NG256003 [Panicum virgatum]